ncbi:MAG: 50S ribosomal protein L4 [Candidatus Pacebacteria bacterium]|nr:50S ribosomal protein L4 [Candidatus Paceibacterota bacterium]MBP9058474.1 50S ribosomal protein L4 [Candidatus Paceibacterota bacterium]MBP9769950.1 50S ribosomal protein L4 [Candidatus Paceibacterota bacterium]
MKTEIEKKKKTVVAKKDSSDAKTSSTKKEASVYNGAGKEVGKFELPENIFGERWNSDLVHQVLNSILANKRAGTANTKNRGEVRGGGKKPWKQKGTGRARHGSSRSPIWVGGGIAHGPRAEKNYKQKVNKKMSVKSLFVALSKKAKDGEILFLDSIKMDEIKTKNAFDMVMNLSKVEGFTRLRLDKRNILLVIPEANRNITMSFRNIPGVTIEKVANLNTLSVVEPSKIIIVSPEASVKILADKLTK